MTDHGNGSDEQKDRELFKLYQDLGSPVSFPYFKQMVGRLISQEVEKSRDSEQNRIFAVLRHLDFYGMKHTATNIMKVRKTWDESAERQRRAALLRRQTITKGQQE